MSHGIRLALMHSPYIFVLLQKSVSSRKLRILDMQGCLNSIAAEGKLAMAAATTALLKLDDVVLAERPDSQPVNSMQVS